MQYNDITDQGAIALAAFLESNKKDCGLVSVNFANNEISGQGIEALQSAARKSSRQIQLRFKGNPGYTEQCIKDDNGSVEISSF